MIFYVLAVLSTAASGAASTTRAAQHHSGVASSGGRSSPHRLVRRVRHARVAAKPGSYYPSCKKARAAGVAPMRRGAPGYRPGLDRNNNGVACE